MNNYAYCTLVGTDNYAWGAIALAYSSRLVDNKYPVVILVTDSCSKETKELIKNCPYALYKEIPTLKFFSLNTAEKKAKDEIVLNRYATTRSKLEIWALTEYARVIFLDADVLFTKNSDTVFTYFETFSKDHIFIGKSWANNPALSTYVEGCVMLITPNKQDYTGLQNIAETTEDCLTDEECTSRYFNTEENLKRCYFEPLDPRGIFSFFAHIPFTPKFWLRRQINSYSELKRELPNINTVQQLFFDCWALDEDPATREAYKKCMSKRRAALKNNS